MVGQREVARLAGVSVATVSRALAGTGRVGGAVRARVIGAAEALGYGRRRMDHARGRRLLLLWHAGTRAPMDRLILDAVADDCRARGVPLRICHRGTPWPSVRAG